MVWRSADDSACDGAETSNGDKGFQLDVGTQVCVCPDAGDLPVWQGGRRNLGVRGAERRLEVDGRMFTQDFCADTDASFMQTLRE